MKEAFLERNFRPASLELIAIANEIIEEYEDDGYDLTLRQLYYQMVSRDVIPNRQKEYNKLGELINAARLAGLVDWGSIVDRTRNLRGLRHWSSPGQILGEVARQFRYDLWASQEYRLEIWVEKDALLGVIARAANQFDVPYFSCRGYTSQSEMYQAGQRLIEYIDNGQEPLIIHLGDHDPSGIDMTRDITDRLEMFCEQPIQIERIALNRDQIDAYAPPPNPAKITDSRAAGYIVEHGRYSWELDALDPATITNLIEETIERYRDSDLFAIEEARQEEACEQLAALAREPRWSWATVRQPTTGETR